MTVNTQMNQVDVLMRFLLLQLQNQRLSQLVNREPNKELDACSGRVRAMSKSMEQAQQAYTQTLQRKEEAIKRLQHSEANSRTELAQIKSQLMYYQTKHEVELQNRETLLRLQKELRDSREQSVKIKQQSIQLKQQSRKIKEQSAKFKDAELQISKVRSENQYKAQSIAQLQKQLTDQSALISTLTQQKGNSDSKNEQNFSLMQQECSALRHKLGDYERQYDQYLLRMQEMHARLQESEHRCASMSEHRCASMSEHRCASMEQQANESHQVSVYHERLATYERIISALQQDNARLDEAAHQSLLHWQQKVKQVETQRDNAIKNWENIMTELSRQRELMGNMQTEISQHCNTLAQTAISNYDGNKWKTEAGNKYGLGTPQSEMMQRSYSLRSTPHRESARKLPHDNSRPKLSISGRDNGLTEKLFTNERQFIDITDRFLSNDRLLTEDRVYRHERLPSQQRSYVPCRDHPHDKQERQDKSFLKEGSVLETRVESIAEEKRMLMDKLNVMGGMGMPLKSTTSAAKFNYMMGRPKLNLSKGKQNLNEMILRRHERIINGV